MKQIPKMAFILSSFHKVKVKRNLLSMFEIAQALAFNITSWHPDEMIYPFAKQLFMQMLRTAQPCEVVKIEIASEGETRIFFVIEQL